MKTGFKPRVEETLISNGFTKKKRLYLIQLPVLAVLVELQKSAFSNQWFINVGFHTHESGAILPDRVSLSHCYYRLERIFPEHRELILLASDMKNGSPSDIDDLAKLLKTKLLPVLLAMGSDRVKLREAYLNKRLANGMITPAAQALFSGL